MKGYVPTLLGGGGVQFPEKKHYVTLECEVMFCDDVSLCFIHSVNYTMYSVFCIADPTLCGVVLLHLYTFALPY